MSLRNNRLATVAAGAAILVGLGSMSAVAANLVNSQDIRDNTIRSVDIRTGAVGSSDVANGAVTQRDLSQGVVTKLNAAAGEQGPKGDQGPKGEQGAKGEPGTAASDVFGKLAVTKSSTAMTPIAKIGGSYATNATDLFTFDLPAAGTYLVNAWGYFDRLDASNVNYVAPTTDSYMQLSLRGPAGLQGGTYFTGAVSQPGRIEATASGATLVTVTEATTITVRAFGYNDDQSGFGGTPNTANPQFSAFASVSAVRVG